MIYGSVCSGIEAATEAWSHIGWRAAFVSDIEDFPRALLKYRHSSVPLHGRSRERGESLSDYAKDAGFQTIRAGQYEKIRLLVGGTPCQSFSIAGLRKGLDDDRGNLALEFCRLAQRLRPDWIVWENVPGVLSSNGGRDFGAILGALGELGYGWAYRTLDAQYVRTHCFGWAVPQRRRRVFVVGYLGNQRRAAAVLFDSHSVFGNPAPRREAGQIAAGTLSARTSGGGGLGTDFDLTGGLQVAHALRAEGFDASEDGTGRGTPLVPVACPPPVANTLTQRMGKGINTTLDEGQTPIPVAFDCKGTQVQTCQDGSAPTLRAMGHAASHQNAGGQLAVAFDTTQITNPYNGGNPKLGGPRHTLASGAHVPAVVIQERAVSENPLSGPDGIGCRSDGAAYTLEARTIAQAVQYGLAVRRLMPRECERLQGFRDDYTRIPYRRVGNARVHEALISIWLGEDQYELIDNHPYEMVKDGPRYKALGNSMAVNCMEWIGHRIQAVEELAEKGLI